jgi:hypothetical protein
MRLDSNKRGSLTQASQQLSQTNRQISGGKRVIAKKKNHQMKMQDDQKQYHSHDNRVLL